MKTSRTLPLSAVVAAAVVAPVLLLRAPASHADPTPVASSASASVALAEALAGSASASASASAPVYRSRPPTLAEEPPGEEKSKPPTLAEWKKADLVTVDGILGDCQAKRVREWVRLSCPSPASSVALLTGPYEGLSSSLSPWEFKQEEGPDSGWGGMPLTSIAGSYHLQFPVRRGERRVYEVMTASGGAMGRVSRSVEYYVNVAWPDGDDPMVLIQRP